MKKKSLKLLLLLPLIVFLVTGCNKGISNEAVKNALFNEENCLKACDEMEDKALADLENCLVPLRERLTADLTSCRSGPVDRVMECIGRAFDRYNDAAAPCYTDYRTKHKEVRKCRKDCRDKFPLELKL